MNSNRAAANGNHAIVDYPSGPVAKAKKTKPVKHGGLMQLYRASRRPLPSEMGDGTYKKVVNRPTLMQDLSTITFAGKYQWQCSGEPWCLLILYFRPKDAQGNYPFEAKGRNAKR